MQYPYLVTPPTPSSPVMSSPITLSPSTLIGDIDMEDADMSPFGSQKIRYIALDTNILIYHLRLVQQVYLVFSALSPATHHLLIPSTVINGKYSCSIVSDSTNEQS